MRLFYDNKLDGASVAITSNSEVDSLPASNIANALISRVWRTAGDRQDSVALIDLGASAASTGLVVAGTDLVTSDQVRLYSTDSLFTTDVLVDETDSPWTERSVSGIITGIATSADGTKRVACVAFGYIYTSTDSGATWTQRAISTLWYSVASSSNGSMLVAVVGGGQIYTSSDSGVNWTARDSNRDWRSVASSADGVKLVAVVASGQIYTSTDSGVNWTARDSNRNWQSVSSSSDGTKLVAVVNGGQIYTSTDSGANWTARDSNRNWYSVASSADGTKLVAAVYGGQIYTSTDSGVNWTARDSNRNWANVTSSSDGSVLWATAYGGAIYGSSDSGVTWSAHESNRNWTPISCDEDGGNVTAGVFGGSLYTYSETTEEMGSVALTFAEASSRYWKVVILTGPTLAARDIGRAFLGVYYTTTEAPDYDGVDEMRDDLTALQRSRGGQIYADSRPSYRSFKCEFSRIPAAMKTQLASIGLTCGRHTPLFVIIDESAASTDAPLDEVLYVRFDKLIGGKAAGYDGEMKWSLRLEFEEQL